MNIMLNQKRINVTAIGNKKIEKITGPVNVESQDKAEGTREN